MTVTFERERRRRSRRVLTLTLAALALAALAARLPADDRPDARAPLNVLLITADDLGLQLSCYGDRVIRTPRLDGLAAGGVLFEVAYITQASCSPSRSSMFTGLYPHATGQLGLTNGGFALHEPLRRATIPALLKKAGYRTGIIGKLHVAPESEFPFDFAHFRGVNTRRVADVAKLAGEFIDKGPRPFFLMVNFSDPHATRRPEDRTKWYFQRQVDGVPVKPVEPGEAPPWPFQGIDTPVQLENIANYYNCVQRLDHGVGLVLSALESAGRAGDTLVIFVGDHGPPFARGKTTCYEAGLRVPFIVRWPGVSRPKRSSAMVSTVDILPTVLDAAGVAAPDGLHGRSLRPVLGERDGPWREHLAAEFHFHGRRPFYPRRAIRDGRFKLIHNLLAGRARPSTGIDGDRAYPVSRESRFDGTWTRRAFDTFADPPELELYDLGADPHERDNLAGKASFAGVVERLKSALLSWRGDTDDPFLDPARLRETAASSRPGAKKKRP